VGLAGKTGHAGGRARRQRAGKQNGAGRGADRLTGRRVRGQEDWQAGGRRPGRLAGRRARWHAGRQEGRAGMQKGWQAGEEPRAVPLLLSTLCSAG
jgi:hypothetical protein